MNTTDRTINLLTTQMFEAKYGKVGVVTGWPDPRRPEMVAPQRKLGLADVERMATRCLARGVPQILVNETLIVSEILHQPYAAVVHELDSLPSCA